MGITKTIAKAFIGIYILLPLTSEASIRYVYPPQSSKADVNKINIFFNAPITTKSSEDLRFAIDKVNKDFPKADKISLLINSPGGDMDAGWMGYWAIKSSSLPVSTINMSRVESSATLFFCASSQREVLANSSFLLHPAAMSNVGYVKPDELARTKQRLDRFNKIFFDVYSSCTNIDKNKISKML